MDKATKKAFHAFASKLETGFNSPVAGDRLDDLGLGLVKALPAPADPPFSADEVKAVAAELALAGWLPREAAAYAAAYGSVPAARKAHSDEMARSLGVAMAKVQQYIGSMVVEPGRLNRMIPFD